MSFLFLFIFWFGYQLLTYCFPPLKRQPPFSPKVNSTTSTANPPGPTITRETRFRFLRHYYDVVFLSPLFLLLVNHVQLVLHPRNDTRKAKVISIHGLEIALLIRIDSFLSSPSFSSFQLFSTIVVKS